MKTWYNKILTERGWHGDAPSWWEVAVAAAIVVIFVAVIFW